MIEYKRAGLKSLSVHFCGNKGNGDELYLSNEPFKIKDEKIKDVLIDYFVSSFKPGIYYNLNKKSKGLFSLLDSIFSDNTKFHEVSMEIVNKLYDQSLHPNIKSGEFYMAYIQDLIVDGEMCDAIGIFKSENKDTFLMVSRSSNEFEIDVERGLNINKLDKGALIFQTEKNSGYKVSIIDNNSKSPEIASYWQQDFLNLVPRQDAYFKTQTFIDVAKGFCEEVLTEENNVPKTQQMMMLNRSLSYLRDKDKFSMKDFEKEVMPQAEVQREFSNYKKDFYEKNDLNDIEEFEVSQYAFNKNKKYLRGIIKLDKNFHIYVHGKHDHIERGFDEERGKKYYKLYFDAEE